MEEKRCPSCKETKPLDQFNWRVKNVRRQVHCKVCQGQKTKRHYDNNSEAYKERAKSRNRKNADTNIAWLNEYLMDKACVDCGEADPIVLEFDHVRGEKVDNITRLVSRGTLAAVQEEVLKCEIRCANCHRRKTAKQFGWQRYAGACSKAATLLQKNFTYGTM